MKKKRGIILICTLVIMIILSIFLMTAVYQMQSSTMVTKKVMWDIKSYWSALAGSTIATDGCLRNYSWPQQGLLEQAGGYIITTDISNNKILVTAEDNVSGSKVTIYHKSKLLNNTGHESPAPPEEILNDHFTNMQLNTSTSDEEQGEIYCLSVGKSGPTVIGLELVYGLYYNPNLFGQAIGNHAITQNEMRREASISAAGAIYVQGDLTANLKNSFKIAQKNGTRGYIVVGGNVDIKNKEGQNCPPNPDGAGPVQLAEGAIFMGGNETKENRICKINGIKIEPDNNSNITDYILSENTFSNAMNDFKDAHLYSIDLNSEDNVGQCVNKYFPNFLKKWTLFKGNIATEFMEQIGKEIDMAFFDIAHLELGEILNFLIALPFLKENAIVTFS